MQKTINGATFKSMIVTAAKLLEINRATVDSLNVFPVPDGDTGTNMSLTLQSAAKEIANLRSNKTSEVAEAVSKGALRGARGNSGVILSQILRGICQVLKKEEEIDHDAFDFGWNNWWEDDTKVCYLDEEFVRDVENYLEKN